MMNLPLTPPTDNLYKFAATSGLLGFLAFVTLTILQHDRISADADVLREEQAVLGAQIVTLEREVALAGDAAVDDPAIRIKLGEVKEKSALSDAKGLSLRRRTESVNSILRLGIAFSVVALTVSMWGFVLWYRVLQKPQDALLRVELAKMQKERQEKKT